MSDDLNADARRLVDLAREARTPGEADKLRIAERLALPLAAGAAVGGAVSGAKAATSSALFGAWTAKVAAVIALGAAAGALVVSQNDPKPTPRAASSLSAPVEPRERELQPPASASPAAAPSEAAPSEAAPREPATQPKSSVLPPSAPSAGPAHELAEEAALLHRAQAAWRAGQSAQALELANQHAQRFPRSQLGNERDVLRVLSLCKLGQARAAKQIGARLLQKAKGSPWYQSVAESCAGQ